MYVLTSSMCESVLLKHLLAFAEVFALRMFSIKEPTHGASEHSLCLKGFRAIIHFFKNLS